MNHVEEMPEGHLHWNDEEYVHGKAEAWRTIIILSVVTIVEVGIAMLYDKFVPGGEMKWALNIFMALVSVVKVIFIMGTFMHLKHETKGFFLTVALPFLFLVWAIIAFSYEGVSWEAMRASLNLF